jgi:hypothetical protein
MLGAGDVLGKGTNDGMGVDGTLVSHTNYAGGSWDDIISRDRNIFTFGNLYWVDVTNPNNTNNWYTVTHPNALATNDNKGKGTLDSTLLNAANSFILPAHTNYAGGSSDDKVARNSNITNPFNLYWVDVTNPNNTNNWYTLSNPNSQSPSTIPNLGSILGGGDNKGKGTGDGMGFDGTLIAHTNYAGGSWDDIISRDRNIFTFGNTYSVDITNPTNNTNWYTMSHPNALATGDDKGKGTNDGIGVDGVYVAHTNYAGGSYTDINGNQILYPNSGRNPSNATNVASNVINKPFGYGFNAGEDYTAPPCNGTGVNVGTVFYL